MNNQKKTVFDGRIKLRPFAFPKRLGSVTGQRLVQRDSPTWYSLTFQKEASVYSLGCTALFDSLRIYQAIDYEKFLFHHSAVLDAKEKREILIVHFSPPGFRVVIYLRSRSMAAY